MKSRVKQHESLETKIEWSGRETMRLARSLALATAVTLLSQPLLPSAFAKGETVVKPSTRFGNIFSAHRETKPASKILIVEKDDDDRDEDETKKPEPKKEEKREVKKEVDKKDAKEKAKEAADEKKAQEKAKKDAAKNSEKAAKDKAEDAKEKAKQQAKAKAEANEKAKKGEKVEAKKPDDKSDKAKVTADDAKANAAKKKKGWFNRPKGDNDDDEVVIVEEEVEVAEPAVSKPATPPVSKTTVVPTKPPTTAKPATVAVPTTTTAEVAPTEKPVLLPDNALVSVLQDISKSLGEANAESGVESADDKVIVGLARQLLDRSLGTGELKDNRILAPEQNNTAKNTMTTEAWASGDIIISDKLRGSVATVWGKRINGMLHVTIAGECQNKTLSNGEKVGEFIVVVKGRSPVKTGFDIQSQADVTYWIGALDKVSIDAAYNRLKEKSAEGESNTSSPTKSVDIKGEVKKKSTVVLETVLTRRGLEYLKALALYQAQQELLAQQLAEAAIVQQAVATTIGTESGVSGDEVRSSRRKSSDDDADDERVAKRSRADEDDDEDDRAARRARFSPNEDEDGKVIARRSNSSNNDDDDDDAKVSRKAASNSRDNGTSVVSRKKDIDDSDDDKNASATSEKNGERTARRTKSSDDDDIEKVASRSKSSDDDDKVSRRSKSSDDDDDKVSARSNSDGDETKKVSNKTKSSDDDDSRGDEDNAKDKDGKRVVANSKATTIDDSDRKNDKQKDDNKRVALSDSEVKTSNAVISSTTDSSSKPNKNDSSKANKDAGKDGKQNSKSASTKGSKGSQPVSLTRISDNDSNSGSSTNSNGGASVSLPKIEPAWKDDWSRDGGDAMLTTNQTSSYPNSSAATSASSNGTSATATSSHVAPVETSSTRISMLSPGPASASSRAWESPALNLAPRSPSLEAALLCPERAIAGQFLTVSVVAKDKQPERAVELSFNGATISTDAQGQALYMIPEDMPPGQTLHVSLAERPELSSKVVDILQQLDDGSTQRTPRIDKVSPFVSSDGVLVIDGHEFDGFGEKNKILIDNGVDAKVIAASPVQLRVLIPAKITPGLHSVTINEANRRSAPAKFEFIKAEVENPDLRKNKGYVDRLVVRIHGTRQPVAVRLVNRTPDVIKVSRGDNLLLTTPGGNDNSSIIGVKQLKKGDYKVEASIEI
jgi:hypothetical protein